MRFIISVLGIFVILLVFYKVTKWADEKRNGRGHSCDAPCVVNFNQPMAEDMFWIDYRGDGSVRVYCSTPDNRFHEVACP